MKGKIEVNAGKTPSGLGKSVVQWSGGGWEGSVRVSV